MHWAVRDRISECKNPDAESVNFSGVKLTQEDREYFTQLTWRAVGRTTYQGANRMIWRCAGRLVDKGQFRRGVRISVMRSLCV